MRLQKLEANKINDKLYQNEEHEYNGFKTKRRGISKRKNLSKLVTTGEVCEIRQSNMTINTLNFTTR